MKKLSCFLMLLLPALMVAQIEVPNPGEGDALSYVENLLNWLGEFVSGWYALIIPLAWTVVRLTPTKRDNDILSQIVAWLNWLVPNNKKEGGEHDSLAKGKKNS